MRGHEGRAWQTRPWAPSPHAPATACHAAAPTPPMKTSTPRRESLSGWKAALDERHLTRAMGVVANCTARESVTARNRALVDGLGAPSPRRNSVSPVFFERGSRVVLVLDTAARPCASRPSSYRSRSDPSEPFRTSGVGTRGWKID
jgi:hypothetical protein